MWQSPRDQRTQILTLQILTGMVILEVLPKTGKSAA